ncbi:MAG: hypothetical protein IPK13_08320 [Deltaproteobacteria bacterium]|nr:hypothetical protein [Deltaproteobacteria bacterium]
MASLIFNPRLNPIPTFADTREANSIRDGDTIPTSTWNSLNAGASPVMTLIDDLGPVQPKSPTRRVAIRVLVDTYGLDRATGTRGRDAVDIRLGAVRESLPHIGAYHDLLDHQVDVFAAIIETDMPTTQLALYTAGKVYGLTSTIDGGPDFSLTRRDSRR